MRNILLLLILLFFLGCQTTTQFIEPDGSTFTVKSGSDSLVTMKYKDRDMKVDNRGKPNIFQSFLEFMFFKVSEVEVK